MYNPEFSRFNDEVILESLCYALEQAFTSGICVTLKGENYYTDPGVTEEMQFTQLKDLVRTIDFWVRTRNIVPNQLDNAAWYSESQLQRIRRAKSLDDIYILQDK